MLPLKPLAPFMPECQALYSEVKPKNQLFHAKNQHKKVARFAPKSLAWFAPESLARFTPK